MIKFRAWDRDSFWYSDKDLRFYSSCLNSDLSSCPFKLKDLEQYTGLKDVKGKLIYVNDYVRVNDCDGEAQVILKDGIFGVVTASVYAGGGHEFNPLSHWEILEVTGHIHEAKRK